MCRTRVDRNWLHAAALAAAFGIGSLVMPGAHAADREIGVDPMLSVHWSTLTGGTTPAQPTLGNNMMVGFWQRSSGAKAGVGSINTGVVEFQLPENPPQRIRSATLTLRARASQCSGAEPVVFEVYGFAGNGQPNAADATSGTRLGQLTANCGDNPAFTQPIDATALVRQLTVPSGLRFVGFSVRKTNHRAGPSFFGFGAAKLAIVVAGEDLAIAPGAPAGAVAGAPGAAGGAGGSPDGNAQFDANKVIAGLAGAAATLLRGGGQKPARDQARTEAAGALSNPMSPAPAVPAGDGGVPAVAAPSPGDAPAIAAATGTAPVATAAAAPAPAAAPVAVDIVGLKLGMTADEIKRGLHAHSAAMNLDETRGIVNNVSATDYLSWIVARLPKGAPAGSSDAIGVHFPPPPSAHRAIFIERFTGFQAGAYPLWDTVRTALERKFGPPSFEGDGQILWTFNAAGTQIVDKSTMFRCGKFPPTDPPARGQNVMFNGYKTAGCGVTIYARYERGRGPSDRDLVRWLSVSLIDDSPFEDMRQAAARFATQANRNTASSVAAPKL